MKKCGIVLWWGVLVCEEGVGREGVLQGMSLERKEGQTHSIAAQLVKGNF